MDGIKFMKKQELIDAAESSGLSRNSIRLLTHSISGSFLFEKDTC